MSSVGWVREQYLSGVKPIRDELRSYWLNHSFLLGWQWTWWDSVNNKIDVIPADADRIQPTMNRMRGNMRTIMANLMQRELTFENPPTSYDDATIRSARVGEAIIEDIRRAHNWEDLREKFMTAVLKGGTAAISVDWDEANKTTVETVLPLGDFVVEPGALNAETARWWVRKQTLPVREVQAIFPDHFEKDLPEADTLSSLDPFVHRSVGSSSGQQVPTTFVFTYYERPNPLCPDGKVLVEVNGRIIQKGDWPFPWRDHLNISVATETAVENQWFGATILDDVRPVQVALNAVWANILEHLRDAGNTRLAVTSSNVDLVRALTDRASEIVEYADGTAPPSYLQPAQLASWVREMPDQLGALMDDIMGVHDVSRGQAPANIESGLGLSILAEKDSSPVGRLIKELAHVFTRVAQMVLMLHEAEVVETRDTTIFESSQPLRYKWKGSDIGGQIGIHVPLDAIIPRSRAAMQAFADKAMEMGLISNVVQYAKVADLPGQEDIIAAAAPDVAKARRENAGFVLDEVELPAVFDDDDTHIQVHNEFRKTRRYEELSPQQRAVVDDHVAAHEKSAAEKAGRAELQNAASPALAAAPNADGSQIPMELLGQMGGGEPPALPDAPPPTPVAPENSAVDPNSMTADMLAMLDQFGA